MSRSLIVECMWTRQLSAAHVYIYDVNEYGWVMCVLIYRYAPGERHWNLLHNDVIGPLRSRVGPLGVNYVIGVIAILDKKEGVRTALLRARRACG